MADYRDLLRRAVEALPENNGASRRQVYEKARKALVGQLRAIEPPLPSREITQHRLQLEDCIRQVEQEATDRLLGAFHHDLEPLRSSSAPGKTGVDDEPDADAAPDDAGDDEGDDVSGPPADRAYFDAGADDELDADDPDYEPPREIEPEPEPEVVAAPPQKKGGTAAGSAKRRGAVAEPEMEPEPETRPRQAADTGGKKSKARLDVVPAAEGAPKPVAKGNPGPVSNAGPPPTIRPDLPRGKTIEAIIAEARGVRPAEPRNGPVVLTAKAASNGMARRDFQVRSDTALALVEGGPQAAAMSAVREVDVDDAPGSARILDPQNAIDQAIAMLDREANGESAGNSRARNFADDDFPADDLVSDPSSAMLDDEEERRGGNALTIFLVLFVLLCAGVGGAGFWAWREGFVDFDTMFGRAQVAAPAQRPAVTPAPASPNTNRVVTAPEQLPATRPGNTAAAPTTPAAPTAQPAAVPQPNVAEQQPDPARLPAEAPAVEVDEKIEDRLPSAPVPAAPAAADAAPAAEQPLAIAAAESQSLLLEASDEGRTGAVPFSGTVDWTRGSDELGQPTLIATANIPARNLSVRLLLRKNSDVTLPASHLMEIDFSVSGSFIGGGIAGLPGVLLKNEELVQGTPLVGASARVVPNSFLFALSAAQQDIGTNASLLRDRKWMDLAMIYATGKRAIITLEKDEQAQAMFREVMAIWESSPAPVVSPAAR